MPSLIPSIIGRFGIFHLQSLFVLCLLKLPVNWTLSIIPIISPRLDESKYSCKTTGDYNEATKCFLPNKRPCLEFNYDDGIVKTITEQFNIVCGNIHLIAISQFVNGVGVFLGYAIGSNLWHLISPRTIILSSIWTYSITSILTGNVFNYAQHVVFRGLMGFVSALLSSSSHMICAEITTDHIRLQALVVLEGFLSLGDIILANFSVYFSSWSSLYTFVGIVVLGLYLAKDLIPEAPNWLLRSGKLKETRLYIERAAILNERVDHIPAHLNEKLEQLALDYSNVNVQYLDLWKDKYTSKNLILAHLISSCFLLCFIGLHQIIRTIESPILQLSSILIAISELCGCVLALYVSKTYNRRDKWSVIAFVNIAGGLMSYFSLFLPKEITTLNDYFAWLLLIGLLKLCSSFGRCILLASLTDFTQSKFFKHFVFSNITFSRLIACISPIIFYFLNNKQPFGLVITFGTINLVGGILIMFLYIPEDEGSGKVFVQLVGKHSIRYDDIILKSEKSFRKDPANIPVISSVEKAVNN